MKVVVDIWLILSPNRPLKCIASLSFAPCHRLLAGGRVSLDEFQVEESEGGNELTPRTITRESAQWRSAVYARLGTTSKMVSEIQVHEMEKFSEIERRLRRMETIVRAISAAPARPIGPATPRGTPIRVGALAADGGAETQGDLRPATLSSNPRTLSVLWDEYVNGIGGRLPASEFTSRQRNTRATKPNFCHRRPFWAIMVRLIDSGCTVATAMARVHRVYDRFGCLTEMLKAMKIDERNGGHRFLLNA